jgi:hypothetical protein
MVDMALVLENMRGILSSKRKHERQSQQSTNSKPYIYVNSSPARPIFCPVAQSFKPLPQLTFTSSSDTGSYFSTTAN